MLALPLVLLCTNIEGSIAFRMVNSTVEFLLYTQAVGGSNPSPSTAHWCNGSTTDSGSVSLSSNLGWAASGRSSNGRTADFGSVYLGSNPSLPAGIW